MLKKNLNNSGLSNSLTETGENYTDNNFSSTKLNENTNGGLKYNINVNNSIKRFAYRQYSFTLIEQTKMN